MIDIIYSLNEYMGMDKDIRAFRKEQGWTQVEMARVLRVKQAAVSKMENQGRISKAVAIRLHVLAPDRFPLAQLLAEKGHVDEGLPATANQ